MVLAANESGTNRLEEAIVSFREALQELNRQREPLEWAQTQGNLGFALRLLGERERNSARLEEAVVASSALEAAEAAGAQSHVDMFRGNLIEAEAALAEQQVKTK